MFNKLAWEGIEDCRKCSGRNGYLLVAGIADYTWPTISQANGMDQVLQCAPCLLKSLNDITNGCEKQPGSVAYLALAADISSICSDSNISYLTPPPRAEAPKDFLNLGRLLELFR